MNELICGTARSIFNRNCDRLFNLRRHCRRGGDKGFLMTDWDALEARAIEEADSVLQYFRNLEALGRFVGDDVIDQKRTFLRMAFINFGRRLQLMP